MPRAPVLTGWLLWIFVCLLESAFGRWLLLPKLLRNSGFPQVLTVCSQRSCTMTLMLHHPRLAQTIPCCGQATHLRDSHCRVLSGLQVLKETYLFDIPVYRPNWALPQPEEADNARGTGQDNKIISIPTQLSPVQRAERTASVLTGKQAWQTV